MSSDLYKSVKVSLFRYCADLADDLGIKAFDFDSTSEEEELPQVNLIGPMEFYMQNDGSLITVGVRIAAVTINDSQIQKLTDYINHIVNSITLGGTIIIRHYQTGTELGHLMFDESYLVDSVTRLKSRVRSLQTVSVSLRSSLTT